MTDSSRSLKRQRLDPRHGDSEDEEVIEPLRTLQRSDGVWESIEFDDDAGLFSSPSQQDGAAPFSAAQTPTTTTQPPRGRPLMGSHYHHDENNQDIVKSTGTQTVDEPRNILPTPTTTPPTTAAVATATDHSRPPTPTRADLIARVLHCPLPHPGLNLSITPPTALPPAAAAHAAVEQEQKKKKRRQRAESVPSEGTASPPLHIATSPVEPTTAPPPASRRRRGRPKKVQVPPDGGPTPAPAPAPAPTTRPQPQAPRRARRVHFSEPAPPEAEPALRSRDSHVFVRLVRMVVEVAMPSSAAAAAAAAGGEAQAPGAGGARGRGQSLSQTRRDEFVWNNRGKGWKRSAGAPRGGGGGVRAGEEGLLDLVGLFGSAGERGPPGPGGGARGGGATPPPLLLVRPVVVPTEGAGVRQPVEMAWDEGRCCFQGVSAAGETLSVTLGEMRESARDPWARQFVGYVMQ